MIAVEWNADQQAVNVTMDEAGVRALMAKCQALLESRDHFHMGLGEELTDTRMYDAVFGEVILEFRDGVEIDGERFPISQVK